MRCARKGAASIIASEFPLAVYSHCKYHVLNLASVKAWRAIRPLSKQSAVSEIIPYATILYGWKTFGVYMQVDCHNLQYENNFMCLSFFCCRCAYRGNDELIHFCWESESAFAHSVRSSSLWHVEWDRKSTRLNSSHVRTSRMPSSAWKKKKIIKQTYSFTSNDNSLTPSH